MLLRDKLTIRILLWFVRPLMWIARGYISRTLRDDPEKQATIARQLKSEGMLSADLCDAVEAGEIGLMDATTLEHERRSRGLGGV